MCQQCGNAPCEPVCPVYAAYHNPEGLNVQVYNRCVGTRYCANNCPYKQRRFNYYRPNFSELAALQLNPDVTVRSQGVMEKCTMCIQRINAAKIEASAEGREVKDGDMKTACQAACSTGAIKFGNLRDPEAEARQAALNDRSYQMLQLLATSPGVYYLEDIKHPALSS